MSYAKLRQTLAEGLETAYKIPEDDIATIIPEKEEDFDTNKFLSSFLEYDKSRIETLGLKGKDKFDQGYNKGKKETLSQFEKEVKETFGIDDDDVIGIDLVKKVVELNSKKSNTDPSKLTEEQLKSHPSVIKMLSEKDKTFKEREQKLKEDFDTQILSFSKKEMFSKVSKKALSYLDEMNPVLSEDPTKANNQKNWLLRELEGLDFQEADDDFIPLKEGKRLEDAHGHGVTFKDFVENKAKGLYDFKKADDRSTPPAGVSGGSGGASPKFKTEQEYAKYLTDTSIPFEDRQKAKEEWDKQAAS